MKKKFQRKNNHYVYILECRDGTYYTGYTPDIKKRVKLHNKGKGAKYTRGRVPVELVWSKVYKDFRPAFLEEIRIKRLKREEKKIIIESCRKNRKGFALKRI